MLVFHFNLIFFSFLVPGPPVIDDDSVAVTLTSISLKWSAPEEPNGEVSKYEVCWRLLNDALGDCKQTYDLQTHVFSIRDLKPGTPYNVSVVAFTKVGHGPSDSVEHTTGASGK